MATQRKRFKKLACLLGMTAFLVSSGMAGQALASATLSPDDCIKCHDKPPRDIAANGQKHKTKVTCVDCHVGHPPKVQDNIPKCSKCHHPEDRSHFGLDDPQTPKNECLDCHNNPHTPLVISLPPDVTKPCLTCHTDQYERLQKYPSKHTVKVACSTCHREKHGFIPQCAHCHTPHLEEQKQSDCLTCHDPHKPLMVTYPDNIPSKFCGACHEDVLTQLRASNAKHKTFACPFCHPKKHKTVPQCQDCHGLPHPEGIHKKFPKCGHCHNIAHDIIK